MLGSFGYGPIYTTKTNLGCSLVERFVFESANAPNLVLQTLGQAPVTNNCTSKN